MGALQCNWVWFSGFTNTGIGGVQVRLVRRRCQSKLVREVRGGEVEGGEGDFQIIHSVYLSYSPNNRFPRNLPWAMRGRGGRLPLLPETLAGLCGG